ncbi:MAG: AAA family ATPase [Thermaerobacter sp.]|nr:AAA family ATPase [Thermaerobacter sp.]
MSPPRRNSGCPSPRASCWSPPGTGKSLSARAVAAHWGLPLARVEFGRLHGSCVGESEKNLRTVLGQLSGMAPVVAWIDEVEKGLAGSGSNGGEIARRMLQTLLTWMQESSGVVIFMTASDVTALPPELLRKGRLDKSFWLDLPEDPERHRNPAGFPLPAWAAVTAGFHGAEIETAVIDALHLAYAAGHDLQPPDIFEAVAATRPLWKRSPDVFAAVRTWGVTHARLAAQDPRRQAQAGPPAERLQV